MGGEEVEKLVKDMSNGDVLLLENVRFYKEETKNEPEFAKKLAAPADLFVNDAFGTAHRAHGSTAGVTEHLSPSVAGFLLQKELDYLAGAVDEPKRPFAAIVGGPNVGSSLVEEDKLELAKDLEKMAKEKGVEFILPTDVILADKFDKEAETQVTSVEEIPDGWMGLDNGPDSTKMIQEKLADCKTVIWNGPMGVFEFEKFAKGTFDVA